MKTLRGHEKDITDAVVIGGSRVNWENPKPPLVVSISSDGSIKAWDVLQVLLIYRTMQGYHNNHELCSLVPRPIPGFSNAACLKAG